MPHRTPIRRPSIPPAPIPGIPPPPSVPCRTPSRRCVSVVVHMRMRGSCGAPDRNGSSRAAACSAQLGVLSAAAVLVLPHKAVPRSSGGPLLPFRRPQLLPSPLRSAAMYIAYFPRGPDWAGVAPPRRVGGGPGSVVQRTPTSAPRVRRLSSSAAPQPGGAIPGHQAPGGEQANSRRMSAQGPFPPRPQSRRRVLGDG